MDSVYLFRKVKYIRPCINFDEYGLQLIILKIQYLQILEYFLRSIKKAFTIQRCSSSDKYNVHLWTQYLARAPLARITASMQCVMEVISLWHY